MIKNPKSKKAEQDTAYSAGQSSGKRKKNGEGMKKFKKVKCYNCKNFRHIAKQCWAKGEKGRRRRLQQKLKKRRAVIRTPYGWCQLMMKSLIPLMVRWPVGCGVDRESSSECNLWTEDEISDDDSFDIVNHSTFDFQYQIQLLQL